MRFSELDELPVPIDLTRLGEGSGIEATLIEHKAKWNKSCHSKFHATKPNIILNALQQFIYGHRSGL